MAGLLIQRVEEVTKEAPLKVLAVTPSRHDLASCGVVVIVE